tara:strand:- start:2662 stop:3318 length:657 start_codon:yes stop_codon:yes gene_type:complete
MSLKKEKYIIIKKVLSKELIDFLYHYFQNKRRVANVMIGSKFISPYDVTWGSWSDPQAPNSYSHYGDVAFDTVLEGVQDKIEKAVGHKLIPTYSYARIYKKGDILKRHTDRYSCEVSVTLHIGGDKKWPIFYDTEGKKNQKGKPITLNSGDLLIYSGNNEHWREPYKGQDYCQVFLHYHDARKKDKAENKYDGRAFPGLPSDNWFKPKHNDWFKKWKK